MGNRTKKPKNTQEQDGFGKIVKPERFISENADIIGQVDGSPLENSNLDGKGSDTLLGEIVRRPAAAILLALGVATYYAASNIDAIKSMLGMENKPAPVSDGTTGLVPLQNGYDQSGTQTVNANDGQTSIATDHHKHIKAITTRGHHGTHAVSRIPLN